MRFNLFAGSLLTKLKLTPNKFNINSRNHSYSVFSDGASEIAAHFRYIKSITSIRGCEAETREITLKPKGIRRYFFGVQLHSISASK
jgi:hypothetical protein